MIANAERLDSPDEQAAIAAISVTDQAARGGLPAESFRDLIGQPIPVVNQTREY